ncbi:hypothetical protein ATKI12_6939 [Kitasatospora sp. Ki12]
MTGINVSSRYISAAHTLTVEDSRHERGGAYIRLGSGAAHLTPSETRRLRVELDGILGEQPARLVVGARVVIVAEDPDGPDTPHAGKAGRLISTDLADARYPYFVGIEDGPDIWCHSVRLVGESDDKPIPADGEGNGASSVVGGDFLRRHEAAVKAKDLLSGTITAGSYGAPPDALIRVADWLLGVTD